MLERIKSLLLRLALGAHNGAILIIINPLMAAYGLWNERGWTKPLGIAGTSGAAAVASRAAGKAATLSSAPPRS